MPRKTPMRSYTIKIKIEKGGATIFYRGKKFRFSDFEYRFERPPTKDRDAAMRYGYRAFMPGPKMKFWIEGFVTEPQRKKKSK